MNRRLRLAVAAAALVSAMGLYLLDRFDIPSWLVIEGSKVHKRVKLRISPIQVSDQQLSEELNAAGSTSFSQAFRDGGWAGYLAERQDHGQRVFPQLVGEPRERLQALKQELPAVWQEIAQRAEEFAADTFYPFEGQKAVLGEDFTWTSFPRWNDDVIPILEVATLQHLPILAQAYLGTDDPRYLNALRRHLESFIAQNPVDNSVNWAATMEVSMRLYSLLWTQALLAREPRAAELLPVLMRTMYAHARFVADTMDRPRKRNNHAIFAAGGLYFYCVSFPELASSAVWKSKAENRLIEELGKQYTDDGVHVEYSPTYQLALADVYLQYVVAKTTLGESVPEATLAAIHRQAEYLQVVTAPDGKVFLIADSDDHHWLRLTWDVYSDARPTLNLAGLLFGNSQLLSDTGAAIWEARWLLGDARFAESASPLGRPGSRQLTASVRSRIFKEEGKFRIDAGNFLLYGDFGRLGHEPSFSGHQHADLGSFVAWFEGKPVAIDPGTYTYRQFDSRQAVSWRDYLRSSMAHNVVTVDGRTQIAVAGEFGYLSWPDAALLATANDDDLALVAGYNGAYVNSGVGRNYRLFIVSKDGALVVDWFPHASGTHEYESSILLGVGDYDHTGDTVRFSNPMGSVSVGHGADVAVLKGSKNPLGGWMSPTYGTVLPAPQVKATYRVTGDTALATTIAVGTNSVAVPDANREPTGGWVIRGQLGALPVQVILPIRTGTIAPARVGNWETDGFAAIVIDGTQPKAWLIGGSVLVATNRTQPVVVRVQMDEPTPSQRKE